MKNMHNPNEKKVYRIEGLSCAHCAETFASNVKRIDTVTDAEVNFGASKITVYGKASQQEIEKAGAFEDLSIVPESESTPVQTRSIWRSLLKWRLILATILVIGGWVGTFVYGEQRPLVIGSFALAILIGGYSLFWAGIRNLVRLRFDMNTLMTIAILGAIAIGEWSEGATVVILFAISEALESFSMDQARRSIRSLMDLTPKTAWVRRDGMEMQLPVQEVQVGDYLLVKPGQQIAMDGIIRKGCSAVNQAAITGESLPMQKEQGDEVFAGTFNEEGYLEVEVTKPVEDTTVAKIIHLVEEAQAQQAPAQAFVDRFARVYTPAILLLGILIATLPPLWLQGDWSTWIYQGLAVLVVGCPCALVISTPIALVTAIGNAARNGVLIKGGVHLEQAGGLSQIAFDKTGTLTQGKPVVTEFLSYQEEALRLAASLESYSQHPLATAIISYGNQEGISSFYEVEQFRSVTGRGIKGRILGINYLLGQSEWFDSLLSEEQQQTIQRWQTQGKTIMVMGTESTVLALFAVQDPIREQSRAVIKELQQMRLGGKTVMLTGDHADTARAIGLQVGIDQVQAGLLPEQKLSKIQQYQEQGERVAMVGDGVNDAPALATATVGIAMGGAGTDTALETADIVLMGDDLSRLPFTIRLSRKTMRIIKQNIILSLLIKLAALLLLIPGWLTLWLAVFADMGATLLVTLNSLRLLKVKAK